MNWFFIALAGPFLWSISNHLDKYLLGRYVKNASVSSLVIFTSLFIVVLLPVIAVFHPDVLRIQAAHLYIILISGVFWCVYLFPYYLALKKDEASFVVPMFQMVPVFSGVLGYIFLKEILTGRQLAAGAVIITGAVGLGLELKGNLKFKKEVFWLMVLASLLVSFGSMLFKLVELRESLWTAVFWQYAGYGLVSAFLLLLKSHRQSFAVLLLAGPKAYAIMGLDESLNLAANLVFAYAYLLAPLALVQMVGSVQPLFVFLLGGTLSLLLPGLASEDLNQKFLIQKFIFILVILIGSYLLYKNS